MKSMIAGLVAGVIMTSIVALFLLPHDVFDFRGEDRETTKPSDAGQTIVDQLSQSDSNGKAAQVLLAAAESKNVAVRSLIASSMRNSAGSLPALQRMLDDTDIVVQDYAHQSHFELTSDLNIYVPYLLEITADRRKTQQERTELEDVLAVVGAMRLYNLTCDQPNDLAKALVDSLSHSEPAIRQCALRQLRAMCVSSKTSFHAVDRLDLQEQLKSIETDDDNEKVRSWASWVRETLTEGAPILAPETPRPLPWPRPRAGAKSP